MVPQGRLRGAALFRGAEGTALRPTPTVVSLQLRAGRSWGMGVKGLCARPA